MSNDFKKENKNVFYGPLPVSEPEPILRPNKNIQLQPTVHPVAITPYISYEGRDENYQKKNENIITENQYIDESEQVETKNAGVRICGLIMLIIAIASLMPFIFSMISPYPLPSIEKYIGVSNIINDYKGMVADNQYTVMKVALPIYLNSAGLLSLLIIFIKAIMQLLGGKRKGYIFFGLLVLIAFAVSALYSFGFNNIKAIAQITTYDRGWVYVTLMTLGLINFVFGLVFSLVCPKKNNEIVDF